MQKEEREQELAYFDQTEQKIKEQVKALRTVIEEGNKKIKEQKQFVWDNTADMDEEELLEIKIRWNRMSFCWNFTGKIWRRWNGWNRRLTLVRWDLPMRKTGNIFRCISA